MRPCASLASGRGTMGLAGFRTGPQLVLPDGGPWLSRCSRSSGADGGLPRDRALHRSAPLPVPPDAPGGVTTAFHAPRSSAAAMALPLGRPVLRAYLDDRHRRDPSATRRPSSLAPVLRNRPRAADLAIQVQSHEHARAGLLPQAQRAAGNHRRTRGRPTARSSPGPRSRAARRQPARARGAMGAGPSAPNAAATSSLTGAASRHLGEPLGQPGLRVDLLLGPDLPEQPDRLDAVALVGRLGGDPLQLFLRPVTGHLFEQPFSLWRLTRRSSGVAEAHWRPPSPREILAWRCRRRTWSSF